MKHFVHIHAADEHELHRVIRDHPLDFGCHPRSLEHRDGSVVLPALVTEAEEQTLRDHGLTVRAAPDGLTKDRLAATTVNDGDRFETGKRPPQGAGTSSDGGDARHGIMNADEVTSAIKGLATAYGAAEFTAPNATHAGEKVRGLVAGNPAPRVFFIGGVHARERGGPDQLLYFLADLLEAGKRKTGISYGTHKYSADDVATVLAGGVGAVPLTNPDGVRFDQQTDSLWRKNRNPASAVAGRPETVGVDINRNYDFLWDFRKHYDPSVVDTPTLASDDPAQGTYHGTAPFSEPETRNVAWLIDHFPSIGWFMDVHSAVGDLLYSWADDHNQSHDPSQNFRNPAWDHKRGRLDVDDYAEWIDHDDQQVLSTVAHEVATAMHAVGRRTYRAKQACGLYAASGTSDGYLFSRSQLDPAAPKVLAFAMEFGRATHFYPTLPEFQQNVADSASGFMQFCLSAAARTKST